MRDEFHIVTRGDTLSGIANRHGVSLSGLVVRNQLRSAHLIRASQRISLPVSGATTAIAVSDPQTIPADETYSVHSGNALR